MSKQNQDVNVLRNIAIGKTESIPEGNRRMKEETHL